LPSLKDLLFVSVEWLASRPDSLWDCLASLTGGQETGADIRNLVVQAGHVQAAFIDEKFLDIAGQLPWLLCQGDVKANLLAFKDQNMDSILDHTSIKIAKLLPLGCSLEVLADAVGLLGQVSWSTVAVEQGHGSCAAV
jgi:hypothetical protein